MTSCLVKSFRAFADLTDAEEDQLRALETGPIGRQAGETLIEEGQTSQRLFIMSEGWSFNYMQQADGGRQVLDINLPGDIVGMREIAFRSAVTGVRLATDAQVCELPRDRLNALFATSPKLVGVFFLIAMRRQALLTERAVNLGRRDAYARLCHLIVELVARLEPLQDEPLTCLRLPLTQAEIGDALGLSQVHVNRVLKRLRAGELVSFKRGELAILDLPGLKHAAGFSDRYLDLDTRWLAS